MVSQAGFQDRECLPCCPQTKNHHIVVRDTEPDTGIPGSRTRYRDTRIQNQTRCEEDTSGDTKSLRDKSHTPVPVFLMSSPAPAQSCPLPGVFSPQQLFQTSRQTRQFVLIPRTIPRAFVFTTVLGKDPGCSGRSCVSPLRGQGAVPPSFSQRDGHSPASSRCSIPNLELEIQQQQHS